MRTLLEQVEEKTRKLIEADRENAYSSKSPLVIFLAVLSRNVILTLSHDSYGLPLQNPMIAGLSTLLLLLLLLLPSSTPKKNYCH